MVLIVLLQEDEQGVNPVIKVWNLDKVRERASRNVYVLHITCMNAHTLYLSQSGVLIDKQLGRYRCMHIDRETCIYMRTHTHTFTHTHTHKHTDTHTHTHTHTHSHTHTHTHTHSSPGVVLTRGRWWGEALGV